MSKAELIDWMICDDIRREDNGKLFFIGVYPTNEILLASTPMIIPQLVISTKWRAGKELNNFEFTISSPGETVLANVSGEIPRADREKKTAFIQFGISPFKIEETGKYTIEAKVNGKSHHIGTFRVGLRSSEK